MGEGEDKELRYHQIKLSRGKGKPAGREKWGAFCVTKGGV
jgi:hypothetical protein